MIAVTTLFGSASAMRIGLGLREATGRWSWFSVVGVRFSMAACRGPFCLRAPKTHNPLRESGASKARHESRKPARTGESRPDRYGTAPAGSVPNSVVAVTILAIAVGAWAALQVDCGIAGCARFVLMNLLVWWSAYILAAMAARRGDRSRRMLLWCVFAFAQVVATSAALGFLGILTCDALIVANVAVLIAVAVARRRRASEGADSVPADGPYAYFALAVAAMAMFVCAAYLRLGLSLPLNHIDDLTHHLRFPVEWMKARRIFICFAPFGFDAPSYAPCNAELFYLWLLAPFRDDVLAKVGQFPFFLASAVAVYRLAKQLGAGASGALLGACVFLLSPAAARQSVTCNVDVALVFLLVSGVSLLLDYQRDRTTRSLAAFAVALGLMLGTKLFAALPGLCLLIAGAPAFLGLHQVGARWRFDRGRAIVAKALTGGIAVFAFGGFWYLRNWVVTGSALYPMAVNMFGVTVMPGAYDRRVMTESAPVAAESLVDVLRAAFGFKLLIAWAGFAFLVVGLQALRRRRDGSEEQSRWGAAEWLAFASPAMYIVVLRCALPYHSPDHFLPAAALAGMSWAVALRLQYRGRGVAQWAAALVCFAHLVPLSCFLGGARSPLIAPPAMLAFGVCAMLSFGAAFLAKRLAKDRWTWLSLGAPGVVTWAIVCYLSMPQPGMQSRGLVTHYFRNYGDVVNGWAWVQTHLKGQTIAHTGDNMPYPLYGRGYSNDVVYVNIDGRFGWKFHDYELHERTLPGYSPATVEKPGYYRLRPDHEGWLSNLRKHGATYLFVATVHPLDESYNHIDDQRFPIERAWADRHPEVFELAFENDGAKIYRVKLGRLGAGGKE